jgi:hypothetical protein
VRVDGEVVRDPGRRTPAGAALDLLPEEAPDAPPDPTDASGAPGLASPLPILHLDRHLLVVDVWAASGGAAGGPNGLAGRLEACLAAAAWVGSRPKPRVLLPNVPGATGLVVAALGAQASEAATAAFASGRARVEILALLPAVPDLEGVRLVASSEGASAVRVRVGPAGVGGLLEALGRAGTPPLRTSPAAGAGPAVHVAEVSMPHPRTGRPLAWEAAPPSWAGDASA